MNKLTYFVRLERLELMEGAPMGLSVRSQDGGLNTFFICNHDQTTLQIPRGFFLHLRNLQAMFNATVQWDYESFLEAGMQPASDKAQKNA